MLRVKRNWMVGFAAAAALAILAYAILRKSGELPGSDQQRIETESQLAAIAALLEDYRNRHSRYPSDSEGIRAASTDGRHSGRVAPGIEIDTWGRPFVYRLSSRGEPILYSVGPNGIDDDQLGDDVSLMVD